MCASITLYKSNSFALAHTYLFVYDIMASVSRIKLLFLFIRGQFVIPTGLYSDRSIFRQVYIPTGLFSDRSIFRQVDIPTGRYSDRSIFRQVYIPTGRYSDRLLFRQIYIPTCTYSNRSLFRQFLHVNYNVNYNLHQGTSL